MRSTGESRTVRVARVTLRLLLAVAFVAVPLMFQPTRNEYTDLVYSVPKEAAWSVLIAAALCALPLLARRRADGATLLLSLFVLGVWVSCFGAVNTGWALLGSFTASFLVLLPFVAGRGLDSERSLRFAAFAALTGGACVAFYALLQRAGWNPGLDEVVGLADRYLLGSSAGSPAAVAIVCGAFLPVAAAAFLAAPWDARRAVVSLLGLSFLAGLFLGGSRPAFMVALVGMIYLTAMTLRAVGPPGGPLRNTTARITAAALLLIVLVGAVVVKPAAHDPAYVEPEVRAAGWKLVKANALLGAGTNHWDILLPLYYPREFGDEIVREPGPPPPEVQRVWGEWGLAGVVGFVGFGLWIVTAPFRFRRPRATWLLGFHAGATGLFVTSFWLSPMYRPGLRFVFWALAAIAYASSVSMLPAPVRVSRRVALRAVATVACLTLAVAALGRFSLTEAMSTRHYLQALWWLGLSKGQVAFKEAIQPLPFHPYYWADYAENRVRVANNVDRDSKEFRGAALEAEAVAQRALRYLPNEPALIFRYATALDLRYGRPWEKALLYERAVILSPGTPAFHVNLGIAYMTISGGMSNQPGISRFMAERALREWRTAYDLDPSNVAAAYNLAENARVNERPEEALGYVRSILRRYPNNQKARQLLKDLGYEPKDLSGQKRLRELAAYWQSRIESNPTDPANYFRAGRLYEELGEDAKAEEYYKEAFLRDPEYLPAIKKLKERNVSLDRLLREGSSGLGR